MDVSYETRICAPRLRRASSAASSVEFVYVVVRSRSGRPSSRCRRSKSSIGRMPVWRTKALHTSLRSADAHPELSWTPKRGPTGAVVGSGVSRGARKSVGEGNRVGGRGALGGGPMQKKNKGE